MIGHAPAEWAISPYYAMGCVHDALIASNPVRRANPDRRHTWQTPARRLQPRRRARLPRMGAWASRSSAKKCCTEKADAELGSQKHHYGGTVARADNGAYKCRLFDCQWLALPLECAPFVCICHSRHIARPDHRFARVEPLPRACAPLLVSPPL